MSAKNESQEQAPKRTGGKGRTRRRFARIGERSTGEGEIEDGPAPVKDRPGRDLARLREL